MKYFKILGPTPEETGYCSSPFEEDTVAKLAADFEKPEDQIQEITKEEFDAAIREVFVEDPLEASESGEAND